MGNRLNSLKYREVPIASAGAVDSTGSAIRDERTVTYSGGLKTVIIAMPDGERIPLQIDATTGLPVFDTASYVLLKRRAQKAVGTMISDVAANTLLKNGLSLKAST